MDKVKKCLLLFAGIPEWDVVRRGEDGYPSTILQCIRMRWHGEKIRRNLLQANPDVEFHIQFSWDTSNFSPSNQWLHEHTKTYKRFRPPEEALGYVQQQFLIEPNVHGAIGAVDLHMRDHGSKWILPEGAEYGPTYSPNLMPFIRMLTTFKATKNKGYDYFICMRPDCFFRRKIRLSYFDNTASIFMPDKGHGGLLFANQDYDYMWGGDYEAVQRLLRLWLGAPNIKQQPKLQYNLTEEKKLEICSTYDLCGRQWQKNDRGLTPDLIEYLIEVENYWYSCIAQLLDEGYKFSTSNQHGIKACLYQKHQEPNEEYVEETPW